MKKQKRILAVFLAVMITGALSSCKIAEEILTDDTDPNELSRRYLQPGMQAPSPSALQKHGLLIRVS